MELAEELARITSHNKILFLKTEPEIENFTRPFKGNLLIHGSKEILSISLNWSREELMNIYNQLKCMVFTPEMTTILWNAKNLISYFTFHLPKHSVSFESKWVDLRLIESFFDTKLAAPATLNEALRRLTPYLSDDKCQFIHTNIHKPLSMSVIPKIETYSGVVDNELNRYVYPSYEIEGQSFGRMNCHKSFDNCVVPTNMGDARKALLKLQNEKDVFVNFDFKHMEVSMLQWLTGDEVLKQAIESNSDLYKGIYSIVFQQPCDTEQKRETIKSFFLPIMFGLQAYNLSKNSNISYQTAEKIINLVKSNFPTAWKFMEDHQEQVKSTPLVRDYFGRPRNFTDKPLSVRGFMIQSPSAVFCQEKLIELHNSINTYGKLIYSIHDGYYLVANREKLNIVIMYGVKALQSESKTCKGLKLKVSCSIGKSLHQMNELSLS